MKWRLTYGDPLATHRSILNSATVDVPAGAGLYDIIKVDVAMAFAEDKFSSTLHVGWILLEARLVPDDDQVVDWLIPYTIARLGFDPTKTDKPHLRRVWADPLARTIWIAIRYRHLITKGFEEACLAAAKEIRRIKPKHVDQLQRAMEVSMGSHAWGIREPFFSQFLPYVLGTKQFGYEVITKPEVPEPAPIP